MSPDAPIVNSAVRFTCVKVLIIPYHHSVHCLYLANMLLPIFLLNLIFTQIGADAKFATKQSLEGLENLVEQLELRLREMELRHEKEKKELETKMETRLKELEEKMKEGKDEFEKKGGEEASTSKLRKEVEGESLGKEMTSNLSNHTLTNPSLRGLPIVFISAYQKGPLRSLQTVTFASFLANFNNAGGGDGVLDLGSGVFTCFTPGYYSISFSAFAISGPDYVGGQLYLYKNLVKLPESFWNVGADPALNDNMGVTSSRILVSNLLLAIFA